MDLETKNIIDVDLVQVKCIIYAVIIITMLEQSNEVKSSYHMELEGLIRAIDCIHDEGLVIKQAYEQNGYLLQTTCITFITMIMNTVPFMDVGSG